MTVDPVTVDTGATDMLLHDDGSEPEKSLRLKGVIFANFCKLIIFFTKILFLFKGQMVYMENWRMIMFLGTPVMPDLTSLITTGLYINDLSMHDFSR